jgi:hypothetical protein
MKRQYEGNHQSNASAQELASNHGGAGLHHQSGTRETFGEFPLFCFMVTESTLVGHR